MKVQHTLKVAALALVLLLFASWVVTFLQLRETAFKTSGYTTTLQRSSVAVTCDSHLSCPLAAFPESVWPQLQHVVHHSLVQESASCGNHCVGWDRRRQAGLRIRRAIAHDNAGRCICVANSSRCCQRCSIFCQTFCMHACQPSLCRQATVSYASFSQHLPYKNNGTENNSRTRIAGYLTWSKNLSTTDVFHSVLSNRLL